MRVGIVGTGVIGTSVGLASRRAGAQVFGWDAGGGVAERAAAAGALDTVAPTLAALLASADTVVLATPLDATMMLLRSWPGSEARLVLDVASVKAVVVQAGRGVPVFVATHPLAGSERTGPEAASADLFTGRTWAYVPPSDPSLERRVRGFIAGLGAAPLGIDPVRHDAVVAFTSHLPQIVSTALGAELLARSAEGDAVPLCGGGMRSMTRLAASQWSVWEGVLRENAPAVAEEVRAFAGILQALAHALEERDEEALADWFGRAQAGAAVLRENGSASHSVTPGTNDTLLRG